MSKERSPFSPGRPVPVEYFVGRSEEIRRLLRCVDQSLSGRNENLFVSGERGIGKSSLTDIVLQWAVREKGFIGAHCYLGVASSVDEICRLIFRDIIRSVPDRSLADKVREALSTYVDSVEFSLFGLGLDVEFTRDPSKLADLRLDFVGHLRRLWGRVQETRQGIILVLDDLNGITGQPEFANFLKSVADTVASSRPAFPLVLLLVGVQDRMDDLVRSQPSIGRIFDRVHLSPMDTDESSTFFAKAFGDVGVNVSDDAMSLLVRVSGGFPAILHEVGDATFWVDQDGVIDMSDALNGCMVAADNVGRKYLGTQVYDAIRSRGYLSTLRRIARTGPFEMTFRRGEVLGMLPEVEQRNFHNFLNRMQRVGIIKSGETRGEYVFVNQLYRLYVYLEAVRAERSREPAETARGVPHA